MSHLDELDERAEHDPELVARLRAVGADPELLGQDVAVEEPEDRLGVPDIDR